MKKFLGVLILFCGLTVISSPTSAEYLPTKDQVDLAISLIQRFGQAVGPYIAVQVDSSHHTGVMAMFRIYPGGEYVWNLEERVVILEGEFLVTRWEFYGNGATVGKYIFASDHSVTTIHHPHSVSVTSPEVISKSELVWEMLLSEADKPIRHKPQPDQHQPHL